MRIPHKRYYFLLAGWALCACAALAQTPAAPTAPAPRTITLQEALATATRNIDAQIGQQQLAAARADVMAANHAPLPVLSSSVSQMDLQHGVGGGSWLVDKRVDKNLGLDWTWERGNKRALRTQAAEQAASASAHDLQEIMTQQKLYASSAFFDLLAAQERVRQTSALAASAQQLADVAAKRLAAGDLSAQDAARSNIEAQRAKNDAVLAEQVRAEAELALGLVLGLGTNQLVASAPGSLEKTKQGADTAAWVSNRADVKAAAARVASAQAALDNALALTKNDVTVGTAIDHFPGTSTRMLTLRMQLPLQLGALGGYTFSGEIARAQAQLASAEAALERARQAAASDAARLARALQSSQERAIRYNETINPQAKQVAEQAELAYNKGALSLTDLLEARRTWRATTLEAIAAQTDFDKALTAWNIRTEALK